MRSGDINRGGQILMFNDPIDGANKILIVNPGHVLPAVTRASAEPKADEPQKNVKYACRDQDS
jgi:hypothetical protein